MEKDYSEYQISDSDRYKILRSNRKSVVLDFFNNSVRFYPEDRVFRIRVDQGNEYHTMQEFIDEYEEDEQKRKGVSTPKPSGDNPADIESREAEEAENQKMMASMQEKYRVEFECSEFSRSNYLAMHPEFTKEPLINIFSGSDITLSYGEGILDFIYADFVTPLKPIVKMYQFFGALRKSYRQTMGEDSEKEPDEETPHKIYNRTQELVEDFFAYVDTFGTVKDVVYSSLYSAICPPKFEEKNDLEKELIWYGNYLLALQREYLELIEFCFDENFYPGALGNLHPSERCALYRYHHDMAATVRRTETVSFSSGIMSGSEMPYGMPVEELKLRFQNKPEPNSDHAALAAKLGTTVEKMVAGITLPHFLNIQYEFGSVAEILELEFTKMLEANVRFRKCKRCGRYFIMKGNYDTNYCDRIAPGQTKNCQELAAIENYKAKIADNKAIPVYNKYYKRYAARVKARQIKEADFKKWKYQALTLRDDCADGKITVEAYIQWMEAYFPNRKPRQDK